MVEGCSRRYDDRKQLNWMGKSRNIFFAARVLFSRHKFVQSIRQVRFFDNVLILNLVNTTERDSHLLILTESENNWYDVP